MTCCPLEKGAVSQRFTYRCLISPSVPLGIIVALDLERPKNTGGTVRTFERRLTLDNPNILVQGPHAFVGYKLQGPARDRRMNCS